MAVVAARMRTCAFIHVYIAWREEQTYAINMHGDITYIYYKYGNHIKFSILQENTGYMKPTTACPVVSIKVETMRAFTSEATRDVDTAMLTPAVVTLAFINICIIIILSCYNATCTCCIKPYI